MTKTCSDCGSKVYGGACVNCDEEIFIEDQMLEEDIVPSKEFQGKVLEARKRQTKRLKAGWYG